MKGGSMTIVVVALIGAGAILLLSAINNTSLVQEFQNILAGSPGGIVNTKGPPVPVTPIKPTPQCPQGLTVPPGPGNSCPTGYAFGNGVCICINRYQTTSL